MPACRAEQYGQRRKGRAACQLRSVVSCRQLTTLPRLDPLAPTSSGNGGGSISRRQRAEAQQEDRWVNACFADGYIAGGPRGRSPGPKSDWQPRLPRPRMGSLRRNDPARQVPAGKQFLVVRLLRMSV
jgi:hypothetical protein